MSVLSDTRVQTADLIGTALGIQSHPAMPDRIVPPAAVILPGSPYLIAGATFGTFTDSLSVVLVSEAKVSAPATAALDGWIEEAVIALVNAGVSVSEVSEPFQITNGGASYLAVQITTTQPVAL